MHENGDSWHWGLGFDDGILGILNWIIIISLVVFIVKYFFMVVNDSENT